MSNFIWFWISRVFFFVCLFHNYSVLSQLLFVYSLYEKTHTDNINATNGSHQKKKKESKLLGHCYQMLKIQFMLYLCKLIIRCMWICAIVWAFACALYTKCCNINLVEWFQRPSAQIQTGQNNYQQRLSNINWMAAVCFSFVFLFVFAFVVVRHQSF